MSIRQEGDTIKESKEVPNWLRLARINSDIQAVDGLIEGLKRYLRARDLSFSDVGVDKKEIDKLLEDGHEAEAFLLLDLVHQASKCRKADDYVKRLENYLEEVGLSLSDIESSKDKIDKLLENGHKAEIVYHVDEAIEHVYHLSECGKNDGTYFTIDGFIGILRGYKALSSLEVDTIEGRLRYLIDQMISN